MANVADMIKQLSTHLNQHAPGLMLGVESYRKSFGRA